jgi:hypothetical protein
MSVQRIETGIGVRDAAYKRVTYWENAHANIKARGGMLERRSPRSIEELLGIEG